ncbi:DNRLRE domain-containing protein [Actinoplanes sp. GCM10030250]|uniref:DNRLRE domain-containing protein n=1 Tax=Actinoplanes sp. GCM10030250 TaxID=3273376 RepID=UPI003618B840
MKPALSLLMIIASIGVPTAAEPAAAAPPAAPAPRAETPYDTARRSGQRAEVQKSRTEYDTTYANPDGTTAVVMASSPVRIRQGAGWTAADATLVRRADGTIGPRAALVDMAFSPGGRGPLARVSDGNAHLGLGAPMTLPAPDLAGPAATYREVLPGVDLVITANTAGFSEVVVVKSRTAAANPALAALRFGLSGAGLAAGRTREGGVEVRDRTGLRLLSGAAPTMWDSRSGSAAAVGAGHASAIGPVEGNRTAVMGVAVDRAAVTVRPDRSLLTDPATVFPVFIDPQFNAGRPHWTMVNRSFPSSPGYDWGRGDNNADEGMGYVSTAADGTHLKRLYFAYDTSRLRVPGRTIVSSTFRAKQVWAYTCTTNRMQVWLSNGISSNTTWNNQPSTSGLPYTERNLATAGRPGCSPGGSMIDFNVTNQVIKSVLSNWATTTLMMRAADETTSNGWRRFTQREATLEVVYNTVPNVPSAPQMTSPPVKCGGAVPALDMPIMQVKATDPDNTANQLRVEFQIWKGGASSYTHRWTVGPGASGSTFRQQMPNLATGSWTWIARTIDNQTPPLTGGWTSWCNFTVDNTAPAPPLIWYDGGTFQVGQDVRFHFTGGGTDVTQYRWAIGNDVPTEGPVPVFDGKATVRLRAAGPFLLRVWAYDAAGNRGSPAVWGGGENPIMVAGGQARDWWRFDEGTGTTSANQKSAANGLFTNGGVSWNSPGYPMAGGSAMVFNGTDASGFGIGQAGPVNGENFTVSIWARPTTVTGKRVLIAQDADTGNASFSLAVQSIAGPKDATGTAGPVAPRLTATLYKPDGTVAVAVPSRRIVEAGVWVQGTATLENLESGDIELHLYTVTETDPSEIDDSATFGGAYHPSRATTSYVRIAGEAKNWGVAGYFHGAIDEAVTAAGLFDATQREQWRYPPVVTP